MLLERCRPGAELRGRAEAEQHVVVTDLLRSVWSVDLPTDHPFRPLSVMADDWVLRAEARLGADLGRLDAGLAREGLALFCELSRTAPTPKCCCSPTFTPGTCWPASVDRGCSSIPSRT
jgi:streptomycin 6-kinase